MKPNHHAQPADVSSAAAAGFDGSSFFDGSQHALQDPQALHMAVPRGQVALSPSIPPGPMPQTPKHMRDPGASIHGVRGLHSTRSVPDFHDLYDVPGLDIATAPGDPFAYDFDFQDPLSPTFYEMPLSSSQTLVLTSELSSVGSAASGSSSFMSAPPPVEGLGIAEPGWPPVSPRSRIQQTQPRVTKKTSKQTLRQKRSRANLDQEREPRPERPSSPAPSTSTSSSAALSPPFPTSPRSPTRAPAARIPAATIPAAHPQQQIRPAHTVRHVPSTPFPVRGKAAASPAMQSPMRPSMPRPAPVPRLPAAAAATALYTPSAPPPDASRRTSMAAAAAAAAASATQQSTTPGSRTPRVSPSTIVASTLVRGPQQNQSAASPTPAARMHSSSKLVSAASDSSPAKGMFSQAQTPLPLSALPKPVQTARKIPSNQSMRRSQARKQPNVIPEMSSAMNQFQVELKPQQSRKVVPPSRAGIEFPPLELMHGQHAQHVPQGNNGPMKKPIAPAYPPRSKSVGSHLAHGEPPADPNPMYFDAPSNQPWMFAGPQPPQRPLHDMSAHAQGAHPMMMPRAPFPQPPHLHSASGPPPPMPQPPQFNQMRPKTVVPVSNETSRVHPQGEPPQHVWVAHPPPPGTPRRRTPRQMSKQQASTKSPETFASPPLPAPTKPQRPASFQQPGTVLVGGPRPKSVMERTGGPLAAPLPPQSAPPQEHAGPLSAPATMSPPPLIPPSMPYASSDSSMNHTVNQSMAQQAMQPGMTVPPDMLTSTNSEPLESRPPSTQEPPPMPNLQEPHPPQEINDGLPSEGDFGFGARMDLSNQDFLDTLEWAPELEMDAQWDFMDVLDPEV